MKVKEKKIYLGQTKGTISSNVGEYSNDPYVLKKAEQSRKTLSKVGFPAELLKLQTERMKK
ncbi:hypothetical protein HDC92_002189 [Pedobacter sp. AK017]|uniref:hypothetical protein n=1 Tax=Pedobacter sp. AK017 TaxID=2723073 RepID=UPI001621625D|nr:hypothetical protein [Pedobacter sp. AK017]MBB5438513.1 hypothetical protein [Pedobacter sp. AK017]